MTQSGNELRRALRPVVLALVALALVAGCTSGSGSNSASSSTDAGSNPAPKIKITPAKGATVDPTSKITVKASGGLLDTVTVKAADGTVVSGQLYQNDTVWRSDSTLLQFGSKYKVSAIAVSGATKSNASSSFTVKESKALRALVSPDNRTVGVGMPITISLSNAPNSRAEVEKRLTVTTDKPVTGAWHWFSDTSLHWRPKNFWPAHTHVTVKADLKGVKFGQDTYGDHTTNASFDIGDSNINTVDVAAHTMRVTTNGKLVKVIPVTTGNPRLPTRAGIKVITTKERSVVMDSATVDIPANSPDAYKLTVKNAMRLTNSGEFIHAAPWSVASQGVANVSHGCTGMSNANAAWMFDHSQIGDVVKYVNSTRPLEQGNGVTDWNIPWSEWLSGSALA